MADTWVLIQHPETRGRQAVTEAAAEHLAGLGWERLGDETFADQPAAAAHLVGVPDDAPPPDPEPEPEPEHKPGRSKTTPKSTAGEPASTKES